MIQYYKIQNDITENIWKQLVGKFSTCISIEMIEYFGAYSDNKSREISKERLKTPKRFFNNLPPEFSTISMYPLMVKWDSFSIINSFTLSDEILFYLENNWHEIEIETLVIRDEDYQVFLYSPLTKPVILLGDGELKWAESIGLKLKKYNVTLNEIIA